MCNATTNKSRSSTEIDFETQRNDTGSSIKTYLLQLNALLLIIITNSAFAANLENMLSFQLKKQKVKVTLPVLQSQNTNNLSYKITYKKSSALPLLEINENGSLYFAKMKIINHFKFPESIDEEIKGKGFLKEDIKNLEPNGVRQEAFDWGNLYAWSTPTIGSSQLFYFKAKNIDWALCIEVPGPRLVFQNSDLHKFSINKYN